MATANLGVAPPLAQKAALPVLPRWRARARVLTPFAGGVVLLLSASRPAAPAPLPLPPEQQEQVNRAIDRGVAFLRATQGRLGTWAAPGASHQVGCAALPGLTLLECGVSPKDPAILRTAEAVRRSAGALDRTYEIALAILFLDRLGDPKYQPVIEQLATRLIVSQAPTGGWGYKCLTVSKAKQQQILVLLRKLSQPGLDVPLMVQGPGGQPPALAGGPAGGKPAAPGPGVTQRKDDTPKGGVTGPVRNDPLRGDITSSPPAPPSGGSLLDTPPSPGGAPPGAQGARPPERKEGARPTQPSFPSNQWARCIKSDSPPPGDDLAPALRTQPRAQAANKAPARPVVIPAGLQALTVFQALDWLGLFDPPERGQEALLPTTDNSNSQFAILALWAAQRHGVPVERTLRRVALRYETSQNSNGSWGYRYQRGGGAAESASMTCVGLLGLAVGYGIDQAPAGQRVAQNPRLLGGFVALSKHVGAPAGRTKDLPMADLYFLWSVERVAVLYDLQTVAGKDWYRWGAEILLANQHPAGAWTNGGYPGASPVLDTCLALLFLKRANLAKDLTNKLPFDPVALNEFITRQAAEGNRPKEKKAESDKKAAPPPPAPPPEAPPKSDVGDALPPAPQSAPKAEGNADWEREGTRARWPYVVFGLGALLLLGAIVFLVLYLLSRKEEEEEARRGAGKPARRPATGRKVRARTKLRPSEAG